MPEPSAETPPTPFGQYQLTEKIAQGGMAEIFKGRALDLNGIERTVVIKRILPHIAASSEFVEMLIDEAKIAVQLSHGNIAQIYDLGKVSEDYFIVMEYVDGKTLSQIMKRLRVLNKQMPIAPAVALCAEVANGLDYMHRKTDEAGHPLHIIHRDISPQNIILSTSGTVKIIDFGIAKAKTKISTTDSGVLKGKFAYMSPEHAEGERLDHRADIFSLGVVLFELLTGQRLFKGKNNPETIRKVKRAKVPTPSELRPSVPRVLDEIVFKALQRDREKRYPSAHAIAQELTRYLIGNHPDFSPRDLVRYLQELFPEIAPGERPVRQAEETPLVPPDMKHPKEKGGDETVAAGSDLIRAKLKEAEVFDLPPEPPKAPEESLPSVVGIEEKTSRIRRRRNLRTLGWIAVLGLLIPTGIYSYRSLRGFLSSIGERIFAPVENREEVPALPVPSPPTPPSSPSPSSPTPPLPSFGFLAIDSEPKGAAIFLNDVDLNKKTPSLLDRIPAGKEQKVGLHLDRYKFWEGKLQVGRGETVRLSIPLEINYGDLEINSLPPGAEVVLNDRPLGKTPFLMGRLQPESTYEVVLRLKGYEPWRRQVKVFGGKKEVVNASLKKSAPEDALP